MVALHYEWLCFQSYSSKEGNENEIFQSTLVNHFQYVFLIEKDSKGKLILQIARIAICGIAETEIIQLIESNTILKINGKLKLFM
jgi:hypothetical protein